MHYLSSPYCVTTPLHVSGLFVVHHQDVECIYVANGTCFTFKATVGVSPTVALKVKQVPFATLHTSPPEDGLQMGPKHVEAWE
jgi:hypothetical protein